MNFKKYMLLVTFLGLSFISCETSDDMPPPDPPPITPPLTAEIEVYEGALIDNGLVLAIENGGTTSYLVDKAGNRVFTWDFADNLGNDLELLPDGRAIGMFKSSNPSFTFGGWGGVIKIVNPDGSIDWEYNYTSENYIGHHDVDLLPNGNVLFLVWEKVTQDVAEANGVNFAGDIFPETLIEVNPATNEIVWEWRSFDHIIQDHDDTKTNFGVVADRPERIDINYNLQANGDFMHANGIDYDSQKDVVYISVNFFSEIWVVDHSTTTAEAATSSGGNYGKGGDLLYRFGNPEVYDNPMGQRLFFNNHFPNLLEDGVPGEGNMLVYVNNGDGVLQSTVYEFGIPASFNLAANTDNEPQVIWSYTNEDLYHGRISGAVRLENGNTLICEGDYGYWEVTPEKEIAWKYNGDGNFWRGYGYSRDYPGLNALGISF